MDPALSGHLMASEWVYVASVGELVGPAVARGLDVTWGPVVGPEASVLVVITDRRVLAIRRDLGGRLDAVVWAGERVRVTARPEVALLLVQGADGRQLVFRPLDVADLDALVAALHG